MWHTLIADLINTIFIKFKVIIVAVPYMLIRLAINIDPFVLALEL
jgi:hypothetical protein